MALGANLPFQGTYAGKQNDFLFPDSYQDPNYKVDEKGAYVKQMLESMYCKYLNGSLGGLDFYVKADLIRAYGAGHQPSSIYTSWAYGGYAYTSDRIAQLSQGIDVNIEGVSEKLNKGWHNVNFDVISPLPKIKETIKGMLDNVDYEIHADTVDAISTDKKQNERLKLLVTAQEKDWIEQQYKTMNLPSDLPEYIPQSKEELDLYEAYGGLKLQCARIQQMLIRHTYQDSGWDELREMLLDDLMDFSRAVIVDKINLDTKKVEAVYQDAKTFFIQPSRYPDHKDSTFGGGIKEYSISYLAAMGFPREKLQSIAEKYAGLLGNPSEFNIYNKSVSGDSFAYDFFNIAVLEASWIEEDTKFTKYVRNKYGKVTSYPVEFGYEPKKDNEWVKKYKKRQLYEGSWVIGTDMVFSFGITYNQPKQDGKLKLPFHVYDLPYKSMTERCIPFLDEFMFSWLHYQNGMTLGMPEGMAMDIGMTSNIELTKGKTASVTDIIKFAKSYRVYPYKKSLTGQYEGGNPTPFSPIQGIQERIINDWATRTNIAVNQLSTITGVNITQETSSGDTATSAQLAYNATINVLKPTVKAIFRIKEDCAESICWRIQNAIKFEPEFKKSYRGIISDNDMKILKDAESDSWGVRYGISLTARPTDQDNADIRNDINLCIQQGLLDVSDSMFIKEQLNAKTDLKLIRMYIQARISKNKEQQQKNQMAIVEQQNQGNLALRQQEGQNMMQKAQMETQKDMTIIGAKNRGNIELANVNNQAAMEQLIFRMTQLENKMNQTNSLRR
jgi:hypothetical protein